MENNELENRITEIEIVLTNQEKMLDELNEVVIRQEKTIDVLIKQIKQLKESVPQDFVKPVSEETPPPHY